MRKYLFFSAMALLALLLGSQLLNVKTAWAQTDQMQASAAFTHEKVDSEKAQKMMNAFVNNARKGDHKFTKFNREDLIKTLEAMEGIDTVKFVIGATIDNTPGIPKGRPVIMLQVLQTEREQPGGHSLLTYTYSVGAICPPPHGKDCTLE